MQSLIFENLLPNYPIDFGEIESTNYLHDFSVQKASFSIVN